MSFKSKILYVFVALLLLSGITGIQKARACHFASADIVVNYIGSGMDGCSGTTEYKYEVLLTIYYACQGCVLTQGDTLTPSTARGGNLVGIYSNNIAGPKKFAGIGMKRIVFDTVSQICPTFFPQNSCNDLNNADKFPAYQREIFRGEINLNTEFPGEMTQTDWTVWFNSGARPNPKNVTGGQSFHIEAGFNNLDKYNSSAPRFTGDALRYICINTKATYLNNVQDLNGDSLVVVATPALTGIGTPIGYLGSYTPNNPLAVSGDNPYYVDPRSGTATFTPTETGMWQLTFRVNKYERGTGKFMGFNMRDVQVQVMDCSEPPPALDPTPATISEGKVITLPGGAKVIYTCPGSTVNFTVNATAALNTSQIYMDAKLSLPAMNAASFTTTGGGTTAVTGTFSWTPDVSHIGEHTLEITSKDSTCSGAGYTIVQKTSTVYTIIVTPGINLGPDMSICAINTSNKQLFARGGENLSLKWEEIIDGVIQPTPRFLDNPTIQNPTVKHPNVDIVYTLYSEDLVGSTCKNRDTVELKIDKETTLDAFPDDVVVLCHPDYLQMDARLGGKKPTGNIPCGNLDPIKCLDPATIELFGSTGYGDATQYDTMGTSAPTFPNNVKTAKMQYLITKDEMTAYGFRSGTINSISFYISYVDPSGAAHPYNNFRIMMGCTPLNELTTKTGFEKENKLTEVYNSGATPVLFPVGDHKFTLTTPYNWDTTQNLLITICYSNATDLATCTNPKGNAPVLRYVPTVYTSSLFYKAPDNTINTVCGVLTGTGFEAKSTRPKFTFTMCEAPGKDFRFWWNPGALLSDSSIQQPLAYVPRTTKYKVETFGRRGCILRDSVMVYIPVNDYNVTPFDSSICYGTEALLQINGTIGGGHLFKWYEYNNGEYKLATSVDCNTCRNVRANPLATTHYKIGVYDSVFCIDTIDAIVKVLPRPEVKLLTRDTVIRYGQSIQLMASGARQYSWIPSGSLSTPNTSAPLATPTEPTSYVVTGIGSNGCRSFDTVKVDIDYRDNILVPTAFSPNGDGKNDVFRVANLTFQRIMEFRVFNRWGQEIYTTNDIKGGWDGTWKGEPQPVDNYRYIIRVAFPDGIVETYKGDVTLIR